MIRLYTSLTDVKNGKGTLINNDSYFNNKITASELDEQCEKWLLKIDEAVIIDRKLGSVKTPYGLTNIESLSTGLKTLINVYMCIKRGIKYNVCITECGVNVLNELFKIANNTGMELLITSIEVGDLEEDFEYLINGKIRVKGTEELEEKLIRLVGGANK